MTDKTTLRETLVSRGQIQDITFDVWCARLRELGERDDYRYGPDPIANCGADCWRKYYNDGYTADAAWAGDGTYD